VKSSVLVPIVLAFATCASVAQAQAQISDDYLHAMYCADVAHSATQSYETTRQRLAASDRVGAEKSARAFWKIADAAQGKCSSVNALAAKLTSVELSKAEVQTDEVTMIEVINISSMVKCQAGTPGCMKLRRLKGEGGGYGSGAGMIVNVKPGSGIARGAGQASP